MLCGQISLLLYRGQSWHSFSTDACSLVISPYLNQGTVYVTICKQMNEIHSKEKHEINHSIRFLKQNNFQSIIKNPCVGP